MSMKKVQYLMKKKMQAAESAKGMIKKRKLAEQLFNSPEYKEHAQKKKSVQ